MVEYFRPSTLEEALELRAARDLVVVSGGTDIYPARVARAAWGDPRHRDVIDISAVPGLAGIEHGPNRIRIGSRVTWSALRRADLPPFFDGIKAAAREVGGVQVQNRGTIAGNLCTASPAGDGIPNLLVLDAEVELASRSGRRLVPVASFVDGYRHTVLRPDEIVTAIEVPLPAGAPEARSGFLKLGARAYLVISIAMAAGILLVDEDGRVTEARVAVGACSAVAQRLPALEAALRGMPATQDLAGVVGPAILAPLTPIDDVRASAAYRRDAALALVRDLVSRLSVGQTRRAA